MKLTNPQKKWLKALRSGKYRQTRGKLKGKVGHCCLGVACEIAKKEGVIGGHEGELMYLPYAVAAWLSIRSSGGVFKDKKGYTRSLANYNDISKYNFKKIADIIEDNAESIFEKVQ